MNTSENKPFGRDSRLRTRSQLATVRQHGRKCVGRWVVVYALEPPDGKRRLATIVSRRYSRRAVDRNRARRLLKEAYRLLLPDLEPAWMMWIARHRMHHTKLGDVLPEIERHMRQLDLLKPSAADREAQ